VLVLGNSVLVIVVRNDHESPEDRFGVTRTRITKFARLASEIFSAAWANYSESDRHATRSVDRFEYMYIECNRS
jgi:hypothetical protein